MALGGATGDDEVVGDLLVGAALGDEGRDLEFTPGERDRIGGGDGGWGGGGVRRRTRRAGRAPGRDGAFLCAGGGFRRTAGASAVRAPEAEPSRRPSVLGVAPEPSLRPPVRAPEAEPSTGSPRA